MDSSAVIQNYELQDSPSYPAWVFCVHQVVDAYGVCPYLKLETMEQRKGWLEGSHDAGKVYFDLFQRLVRRSQLVELEQICEMDRANLDTFVRKQLDDNGFVSPSNDVDGVHPLDYIVQSIIDYQTHVTHRTKALRTAYQRVMEFIDQILDKTGINFVRYVKIVHDTTFRYRCNAGSVPMNIEYERLCDALSRSQAQVYGEDNFIAKMRSEGAEKLASLMANDFEIQQNGKYFKRWTMLSMEQKIERLVAFAATFIKKFNVDRDLVGDLSAFLEKAIVDGVIKTNCIKWSTKLGVIETIEGLLFDAENGTFDLDNSAKTKSSSKSKAKPKSVTFADGPVEGTLAGSTSKKRGGSSNSAVTRKVQKKTTVSDEDKERLNRLLIDQLVDDRNNGRTKETVIQQVLNLYSMHASTRQRGSTYLSIAMDHMVDTIRENPM